ncbi:hypothetical protein [Streptomyces sp. NPDC055709]
MIDVSQAQQPGAAGGHLVVAEPDKREPKAAYDTCQSKMPLMPDELNPKTNPEYKQQLAAQVACMQKQGAEVTLNTDFSGWSYASGSPKLGEAEVQKIDRACRLEAFGGKH